MTKTCSRCHSARETTDFPRNRRMPDGIYCYCKPCQSVLHKEWRAAHPEHNRQRMAAWRAKAKATGHLRRWQKGHNLKRYGVSLEQYEAMFRDQGGVCAICREPETFVRAGKVCELAVDHDHATGAVRALLCSACNHALGCVDDDPARLRAAADYLETHRGAGAPR